MATFNRIAFISLFTFVGAIIALLYTDASLSGKLKNWQSMGSPPEKAVRIMARDYVETQSGFFYHYEYESNSKNGHWVNVKTIPSDEDTGQPVDQADCLENSYYPSVENYVDSKSFCYWYAPQIIVYINVIDNDGIVYSWERTAGEDGIMWFFVSPFFGGIIGFNISFFLADLLTRLKLWMRLLKRFDKK